MSCWEVDSEGRVKVHVFKVLTVWKDTGELFEDCEPVVKEFTDYTDGWNWARRIIAEIEASDPDWNNENAITGRVELDSYWREDDDE